MKKYLLIAIYFLTLSYAFAQSEKVKKANKLFDNLAYSEAIPLFLDIVREGDDVESTIKLAECYRLTKNYTEALNWYDKITKIPNISTDYFFYYAELLRNQKDYAKAKINYLEYAKSNPAKGNLYAKWCDDVVKLTADSAKYTINKLKGINTKYDDFGSVYYNNGLIFVSSGQGQSSSKENYHWDGFPYLDLYFVPLSSENSFGVATQLKGEINTKVHEGPATFIGNTTILFTRNNFLNNKANKANDSKVKLSLYQASLIGGEWKNIIPFQFNNANYSVGHGAYNRAGDTLYFVSDMPGGFGQTDIYFTHMTATGWSQPQNMGDEINTDGAEMFPYVADDGTLYYSSDGLPGFGGLDIYFSKPYKADKWSAPVNIGFPLNGSTDDFGMAINTEGNRGYFSSNRVGGEGGDDIYEFRINKVKDECTQKVEGKVIDETTGQVVPGVVVIARNKVTGEIIKTVTNEKGEYSLTIKCGYDYVITFDNDQFFRNEFELNENMINTDPYRFDKALRKIEIDKPIVINNIYYDLDKYYIRPDAAVELDKLVKLLKNNPKLIIELSSHTDCRASNEYNRVLSENRAKSAVEYLIQNGIDSRRLFPKGYGETKLINECRDGVDCPEEKHALNRRTEFKVIGYSSGMKLKSIPLDSVPVPQQQEIVAESPDYTNNVFLSPDYAKMNTSTNLSYVINLGVFKSNVKDYYYNLTDLGVVSFTKNNEGLIKYTLGTYYDFKTVASVLETVKARGSNDAYISAFSYGKPIDLDQAKALETGKK